MAVYDAQLNNTARNTRQYTDLDLFFGKKSSNNDIQTLTDVQAVKRSIRNLVQLNVYDKPFHPEIAGGIREMLFENMSPLTAHTIARTLGSVPVSVTLALSFILSLGKPLSCVILYPSCFT